MDTVSVAAFDRTSMALIRVIQEDAWIIDGLRADVQGFYVELVAVKAKLAELRRLCEEQDHIADEMRVPREDGTIDVSKIREVLGP